MPRHARRARVTSPTPPGASQPSAGKRENGDGHGVLLGKKGGGPRLAKRHSAGSARRNRSHAPPGPVPPPGTSWRAAGDDEAPAPHRGAGWASLTDSTTRSSGTPPTTVARGRGRWERETTPPARSQAPETTWSAPGAPRRARRNAHSAHAQAGEQRGVGTALPAAGRTAHHTRSHGRQARVSAASEDPGPASAAKQNAGRRGRAGACTSSPPHPRHTATAGGGEGARGPAGRTRRAIPFAMNVRPSSGAA